MGIWHLKTYIDTDQSRKQQICVKVRLKDLAEEWRKIGGKSIIVADGHNIQYGIQSEYEFVSGGEFKTIVQRIEKFIRNFKEIGVDLVVFFGADHRTKVERKEKYMEAIEREKAKEEVEKVFNEVEKMPILQQSYGGRGRPVLFGIAIRVAVESLTKVITVGESRNRRMVEYVIENKCVGILSDDTDMFVYDGVHHIFSRHNLCLEDMTTIEYRRSALLKILGLPGEAMPIFSTLMSNNIIPYYPDVMKYHKRKLDVEAQHVTRLYQKVCVLVKVAKDIFEKSGGEIKEATTLLAEEILGLEPGCPRPVYLMDFVERSLLNYKTFPDEHPAPVQLSPTATWNELKEYATKTYAQFPFGKKTVTVMDEGSYSQRAALESSQVAEKALSKPECHCVDCGKVWASKLRCMCGSEALFELRRRIYSVILFEKSVPYGSREFVKETFITGCRDNLKAKRQKTYLVSTIPIGVEHPGLYRQWFHDSTLDNTRWKLFFWILSSQDCDLTINDGVSVFRQPFFKDHFGLVGFVLLYLYKVLKVLSRKELEVLLVMTASLPVMNADELKLRTAEFVKKRAVSLSTLYQMLCCGIIWASKLCNLKLQNQTCDLYSGLYFHYLFQQDHPTEILDDLPPQARHNYKEMRSALIECCVDL